MTDSVFPAGRGGRKPRSLPLLDGQALVGADDLGLPTAWPTRRARRAPQTPLAHVAQRTPSTTPVKGWRWRWRSFLADGDQDTQPGKLRGRGLRDLLSPDLCQLPSLCVRRDVGLEHGWRIVDAGAEFKAPAVRYEVQTSVWAFARGNRQ